MTPKIFGRLATATLLALTVATHLRSETVTGRGLEILDQRADGSDALCCLSGADTARDGSIVLVSDLGVLFGAELDEIAGTLAITSSTPLRLSDGSAPGSALSNAEGLTTSVDRTHAISFEGRHRRTSIRSGRISRQRENSTSSSAPSSTSGSPPAYAGL